MFRNGLRDFLNYAVSNLVIWLLAVYLFTFLRFFGNDTVSDIPGGESFNVFDHFLEVTLVGLIFGLMFVFSDFILKKEYKKKRTYAFTITIASLVHVITFFVTVLLLSFILVMPSEVDFQSADFLKKLITSKNMWAVFVYFFLLIILLNIQRYVRKVFGPGVLVNIIRGKYYKPRNEKKIFMFLDLISSTTYAEQLGSLKFTELIQDCFFDVSSIVKKHHAEIYQYVGDEVILMWDERQGVKKNNAFQAFFSFMNLLELKSGYYLSKYKTMPVFKAGIHYGIASVGEVGEIKKEIAYLGDAVNIASRLLGVCNQYNKQFLASEEVVQLALPDQRLKFNFIEEIKLKGKNTPTKVYSVEKQRYPQ